jgi:hypothetical protein
MAPKSEHQCQKEEIIEAIRTNLGIGAVSFAKVGEKLEQIETVLLAIKDQTTKTNGRVTKLEQFTFASRIIVLTSILTLVAIRIGLLELILKLL